VGSLTNHLVVPPHAHAEMTAEEQRVHDETPHIHCGQLGHQKKGHSHPHCKVENSQLEQQHKSGNKSKILEDAEGRSTDFTSSDHDADAIYIPEMVCAISIATHQELAQCSWNLVRLLTCSMSFDEPPADISLLPRWQTPAKVLDASETFLTLRNLRL